MPHPLRLGVGRADITPPAGIPMVGFANRGPSTSVHDPLEVKALAVEAGATRALLLTADLLGLREEVASEFRRHIGAVCGFPAERIALAATHNHYGPDVLRSEEPIAVAYLANLKHLFASAAREALGDLRPARLAVGWGSSDIGINRRERRPDGQIVLGRNPEGPVDRRVGVVRMETGAGEPLATLVGFACHPVCQDAATRALSADYPGEATRLVEDLTGAPCLFLQGACGDINPVRMEPAYEPARSLGTRLGCEVVRVWETLEASEAAGLWVADGAASLPRQDYGSLEQAEAIEQQLRSELRRQETEQALPGLLAWTRLRLERARSAVESWRTGVPLPEVSAPLHAWRLGPLAMAMAPGEIFSEIGAQVQRASPLPDTWFIGYTNGYIGYVPTRPAYAEGGYEVLHACQVGPEAGERLVTACLDLLRQLG